MPAFNLVGQVHDGWRVAGATLAGERQMVAGSGSGGVDRIGDPAPTASSPPIGNSASIIP